MVVRASPPPQAARPGSHELPVDPNRDRRWGFPCCVWSPVSACRRQYPGRIAGIVRSSSPIDCGLPRTYGGSAPALFFSRPAQRSLSLQPACLPSRLERPSTPEASAASLPPLLLRLLPGGADQFPGGTTAVDQRLSRRTKYLNNVVEQDHRTVKQRTWLAKGYGSFQSAWQTLQGIETVSMIRKGRVRWVAKGDAVALSKLHQRAIRYYRLASRT
jgi:hypothetical protein